MPFLCGSRSGSADPCLWLMEPDPDSGPDPDPAIFVIDLQDANKKLNYCFCSYDYFFLEVHSHHFSKIKLKRCHKAVEIKVFLKDPEPYLWLIDPDPDPGGPETYGSDGTWYGFGSGSATLLDRMKFSNLLSLLSHLSARKGYQCCQSTIHLNGWGSEF